MLSPTGKALKAMVRRTGSRTSGSFPCGSLKMEDGRGQPLPSNKELHFLQRWGFSEMQPGNWISNTQAWHPFPFQWCLIPAPGTPAVLFYGICIAMIRGCRRWGANFFFSGEFINAGVTSWRNSEQTSSCPRELLLPAPMSI